MAMVKTQTAKIQSEALASAGDPGMSAPETIAARVPIRIKETNKDIARGKVKGGK